MADKKIKIEVDLDAEPSIAAIKQLKKELRELAVTDPKFAEKQQQINDFEDALKSAKTGASNFTEILGEIPGPLGEIGNKLSSTVNILKQFGGLKLNDLKTSFVELGKDVGDAAKGLGKLTGITKAYTVVSNFLAASFVKVGIAEGAAAIGAKALSAALISTGIGALVVLLGTAASALMDYFDSSKKAEKAADDFTDSIKRQNDALSANLAQIDFENKKKLAQAKIAGKSEDELNKITQDGLDERYNKIKQSNTAALQEQRNIANKIGKYAKISDEEKSALLTKNLENLEKLGVEESRAREAKELNALEIEAKGAEKRRQNTEKNGADTKASTQKTADDLRKIKEQELKDIQKNEKEAVLSLFDIRDQERRKIINDYRIKLDLAAKYGADTSTLEEAKLKALQELNDKYKKEDDEKAEELKAKQREAAFEKLQTQIDDLTAENDLVEDDFQQDLERLELKREKLNEQKEIELSNLKLTEAERIKIIAKYAKQEQDIDKSVTATKKAELAAKRAIQMQYADFVQQFGNLLSSAAGKNKTLAIAGIIIEQGAALAKVIMSTQTANAAALATPQAVLTSGASAIPVIIRNNIQGALSAAAIVIGAVKGIASINSAQIPGGSGSGGSASGGGAEMPAYNSGMAMNTPQINTTGGANPATQISQTIQNAQSGPIKAYVVSGDITSQQQLERKANRGATFNLG